MSRHQQRAPRSRTGILCAALCVVLAGVVPAWGQAVVDGVVAVAGEHPLMLSEVQFEAEIQRVFNEGARQVNLGPSVADAAVLDALIDRSLLLQEATAEVINVDDEVSRRLKDFLDRFDRVEDLTRWLGRWKIGTAELTAHFVEEMRAHTYAELRLLSSTRVSERDLNQRFDAEDERWQGIVVEEARDTLRYEIWQERYDTAYRQWLDTIREKRGVRLTALGRSQLGGEP